MNPFGLNCSSPADTVVVPLAAPHPAGPLFTTIAPAPAAPPPASLRRDILLATPSAPPAALRALAECGRERRWRLTTDLLHTGTLPGRWQGHGILMLVTNGCDLTDSVAGAGVPWVTVSLGSDCSSVPRVQPDYVAIGALAAHHLVERECREFVWAPFTDDRANHEQLQGFQAALRRQGLDCHLLPPAYRRIGQAWNDNAREWRQAGLSLLGRLRGSTGVFAFNDCLSSRVMLLAQEADRSVPEQVAVIGVGNDPLDCESGPVTLSTIDPDLAGLVTRAAEALDALMDGQRIEPVILHPPKGILPRASTNAEHRPDTRLHQAAAYIAAHSADPHLSVTTVADKIGLSRRQLERGFRTLLGRTVRQYIEDLRMETAARLVLEHPHSKILTIAETIGVTDPNSFFRKFRKRFGTTPAAFRRQFSSHPDADALKKRAS